MSNEKHQSSEPQKQVQSTDSQESSYSLPFYAAMAATGTALVVGALYFYEHKIAKIRAYASSVTGEPLETKQPYNNAQELGDMESKTTEFLGRVAGGGDSGDETE